MDALKFVDSLRKCGLSLRVEGDRLVVDPGNRLTEEQRAIIRAKRAEIMKIVRPVPADLEQRIRAMAGRWHYSSDELAESLQRAAADPAGWLLVVLADEESLTNAKNAGASWPT